MHQLFDLFKGIFSSDSSDIYCDILDHMEDEIFIFDRDFRLVYMNRAAERSEQFTLKDNRGKSLYEIYDFQDDLDESRSPAMIAIKTEKPVYHMPCSYFVGHQKNMKSISSAPIYQDGVLVGAYTIQHDLTQFRDIVEENINLQKVIQNQKTKMQDHGDDPFQGLIGSSTLFKACVDKARCAAETNSAVLLVGETGSGKEVFARAIHDSSDRSRKPFLALNCAAIPESLLEGILFGTTKGVYTGAVEKDGILMQANGGTVFLDEVNSMPLASQAKLLRVLEEKKVMKLGSSREVPVDIRIISSMNESPFSALENHHLRRDLFYRLSVVQIQIPPLRGRNEDILSLCTLFVAKYSERFHKRIQGVDHEVLNALLAFDWPGNVRQLKACMESAMNFVPDGGLITTKELPDYICGVPKNHDVAAEFPPFISEVLSEGAGDDLSLTSFRRDADYRDKMQILAALKECGGNVAKAARMLGISRQLLNYRLKKYGLK